MAGTATGGNEATAAKKRKAKPIPEGLLKLNESTFRKVMKFRLETDSSETGEVKVAYEVSLIDDHDGAETTFNLEKLTLDQLRKVCQNCGVQYVNKKKNLSAERLCTSWPTSRR